MADKKISQLTNELSSGDLDANDLFAIVDVSASETKKIKAGSLSALIASNIALSQLSDVDDTTTPLDTHVLMGNGTLWQSVAVDVLPTLFFPTMVGQAGEYLKVNPTEDGFLWDTPAGGGGTTLPSYTGNAGLVLAVNATEDGVEWVLAGGVQLDTVNVWTAGNSGTVDTVAYGSNVTLNFSDSNFFKITLTGNIVLENPTNIPNGGKSGSIWLRQDATGSRTWALGSYWKTKGLSTPSLSTTANAIDRIDYIVESSTRIEYSITKGLAL